MTVQTAALKALASELDLAIGDSTRWRSVCDSLAAALGGVGTIMIPVQPEKRGLGLVHSDSVGESLLQYIGEEWFKRDFRQAALPVMRQRGFATDHDITDRETMRTHPFYTDFLARHGLGTFVGIYIEVGDVGWVASIQRSIKAGAGGDYPDRLVPAVRQLLGDAIRASAAIGGAEIRNWQSYFDEADRGLVVLEADGLLGPMNGVAARLLAPMILQGKRKLTLPDPAADARLRHMIERACSPPPRKTQMLPVFQSIAPGLSLVFDVIHPPNLLKHFYSEISGLMAVRLAEHVDVANSLLSTKFGLSPSEIRVANAIKDGLSPKDIAATYGLAEGTVRQQLKSALRKTDTRSQTQLVNLLARLS